MAMIKTDVNNYGKCCKVAWGECFGRMSKMIIQELVEAYIKCITLLSHVGAIPITFTY